MVLRCSLLGHDYGELETEREREERGSEVVVTVREFETCARCGDVNVVSESTEVRPISTGEEPVEGATSHAEEPATEAAGPGVDDEPVAGSEPEARAADDGPDVEDDAVIVDDGPTTGAGSKAADAGSEPEGGAASVDGSATGEPITDEAGEPITDDGEILDERPDDRAHGEWPAADDVGPPVGADEEPAAWPESEDDGAEEPGEPAPWPEADDDHVEEAGEPTPWPDDEPAVDDDLPEDDAVILEDGPADADDAATDDDPVGPETPVDGAPPATEGAAGADGPETGIASAGTVPAPGASEAERAGVVALECPRCSFAGTRSSLRPGDICPECHKGYLAARDGD